MVAMSTNLEAKLREELTTAMKAKDTATANLVRMINTKIMERRTAKDFTGTVDDALILDVIGTYKKQMEKARQEYAAAGDRGKDQVAELEFEIAWCAKFLPKQLEESELREAVAKAVAGTKTASRGEVSPSLNLVLFSANNKVEESDISAVREAVGDLNGVAARSPGGTVGSPADGTIRVRLDDSGNVALADLLAALKKADLDFRVEKP